MSERLEDRHADSPAGGVEGGIFCDGGVDWNVGVHDGGGGAERCGGGYEYSVAVSPGDRACGARVVGAGGLSPPILAMAGQFAAAGAPARLMPKRRLLAVGLFAALCRFMVREHIDIVHAFSSTAEFFGGVAARLCGRRLVASSRNYNQQLPWRHRVAKRAACALAGAVAANSRAGAVAAVQTGLVTAPKTHVIANGVSLQPIAMAKQAARAQLGMPQDALVALSVGRLVPVKGYDATLALARRLHPRLPHAVFVIVGDGPQ